MSWVALLRPWARAAPLPGGLFSGHAGDRTRGNGNRHLSYISGAAAATASGIDSGGNIVGWSASSTVSGSNTKQAFYLPSGGTSATLLPNLSTYSTANYSYSAAQGVNAGKIVGESVASDGNTHAVVWTNTAGTWGVADLDLGVTGDYSWAYGVNSSGVVAGQAMVNSRNDAVTWSYNGSAWTLHDLIDRTGGLVNAAAALAINSNGDAVGWSSVAALPSSTQYPV